MAFAITCMSPRATCVLTCVVSAVLLMLLLLLFLWFNLPRWIAVLRGAFLVVRMLILEIFKFFPTASALVVPPESRENVRLPQPVAGVAGAEREKGEEDRKFDAHLVTPHVKSAKSATGPKALIASQIDWRSQRDSW